MEVVASNGDDHTNQKPTYAFLPPSISETPRLFPSKQTTQIPDVTQDKAGKPADKQSRFPRIIVRDPLGLPLDTDTSLQQAIYEARARLARGEPPRNADEWRLPGGPVPARPDYTRVAPPLAIQREYKRELRRIHRPHDSLPNFAVSTVHLNSKATLLQLLPKGVYVILVKQLT